MILPSALVDDEKILYKRISELVDRSFERGQSEFSFFLNPREQQIARIAAGSNGDFFGGFSGADRKMFGIKQERSKEEFPICAVNLTHDIKEKLNHRWVLGSLMSLGITRGNLGDIIPSYGSCVVLCSNIVKPILLDEIKKIGLVSVKTKGKELEEIVAIKEFEKTTGTVSSVRLDGLVAMVTKLSRAQSAELFKAQKVFHNYKTAEKGSVEFSPNDIITIRGYGKYIIDCIGKPTKKGKLPIECRKYL